MYKVILKQFRPTIRIGRIFNKVFYLLNKMNTIILRRTIDSRSLASIKGVRSLSNMGNFHTEIVRSYKKVLRSYISTHEKHNGLPNIYNNNRECGGSVAGIKLGNLK